MAIHTLGTTTTTVLKCIAFNAADSDADIASIAAQAEDDFLVKNAGIPLTCTTHGTTSLTALSSTASLAVGMGVIGVAFSPNTFIEIINSSTAVTLNQVALTNTTGQNAIFLPKNKLQAVQVTRQGLVKIPNRGALQVFPGDVIAVDPQTGWPIVVSAEAIAATGSVWHFV